MLYLYVTLIAFAVSVCTQAGMFYLAKRAMRHMFTKAVKTAPLQEVKRAS